MLHYCSTQYAKKANAVYLMAGYLLVVKKWAVNKIIDTFGRSFLSGLETFRDAGIGPDDFPITIEDCLKGLKRAIELGFYTYSSFNLHSFE